jgi:hypothetical protein
MKKNQYIIYVVVMVVVVATFSIVFNFFSRPTYSELENRELAKSPSFSWKTLFAGSYTRDVSSWYSDSEPYRDHFMTLSMEVDKAKMLKLFVKEEDAVTFIAGDERNSTRLGNHMTSPLDSMFAGCTTKGIDI